MEVLERLGRQTKVAAAKVQKSFVWCHDKIPSPTASSTCICHEADVVNVIVVIILVELEPHFDDHKTTETLVALQEDHVDQQWDVRMCNTHQNLCVYFGCKKLPPTHRFDIGAYFLCTLVDGEATLSEGNVGMVHLADNQWLHPFVLEKLSKARDSSAITNRHSPMPLSRGVPKSPWCYFPESSMINSRHIRNPDRSHCPSYLDIVEQLQKLLLVFVLLAAQADVEVD